MINIVLFCSAGMSTSLLVSKMEKAAQAKGIEVNINAYPEAQMAKHIQGADVVLLGPQVKFLLPKAKKLCSVIGVPVETITPADYGMMNGEKVLAQALKLAGK